ncbi:GNAT family N-acetyltransferase [Calothrix sp. UHCC 0171]|uniref:GNAT family N-acetyltransferase n=1 Tax=Calothrix sp. UHCC 0171 TaxID=3110245 RepID=UPI002B1E9B88|nr:GNAT family N-acetyltransferase [Calothrix sp. UHCC 0171]MEA5574663.1 GNAT family N-acetyltransferase [Calothrix sp. UHCC 0171]
MLYQALFVPPDTTPLPKEIIFQPELAKYVQNWGLNEDQGLIAVLEDGQTLVGAVWLRIFKSNNPGYGYIDDHTPELSIAVLPQYRDRGIGTKLLSELFSQVRNQYSAVSLSVSSNNPALRLYHRLGFEVINRQNNSLTMKKDF